MGVGRIGGWGEWSQEKDEVLLPMFSYLFHLL